MVWKKIKTGFMIIAVFSINIIASLSITGKMTLEFTALSIIVAGIFWLIISLEEKHDKLIRILEKIERNTRYAPNGGLVEETENEEEEKTSGAGAFLGLIIGGLLGLSVGGAGVLVGGIVGGLIGDLIESESIKERHKKIKA